MNAKRCLNCLSLNYFVRTYPSKCRICELQCRSKHTTASHECFDGINLGAAEKVDPFPRPVPAPRFRNSQNDKRTREVHERCQSYQSYYRLFDSGLRSA